MSPAHAAKAAFRECRERRREIAMSNPATRNLTQDDLIVSSPDILEGRRVFRGTRVPVDILFENLADGMSLDEILDHYETLNSDDVVKVIELTSSALARPRAA